MKTKKLILKPDFQYAEFSGEIFCPFCKVLLKEKPLDCLPADDEDESDSSEYGELVCKHVGLWVLGSDQPSINENWREVLFTLTKEIKGQVYDGEEGYYWQEALELFLRDDGVGHIGNVLARAMPTFQVAVYKQFTCSDEIQSFRHLAYMAIILRKR